MSADLFAAFESTSSDSSSQKNKSQPGIAPNVTAPSDPFSFLSISGPVATPQPQASQQQQHSFRWQPALTQPAAPANTSLWPTAPTTQSQNVGTNVWGDLGGLGGFQTASGPPKQEPTKEEDDDWGDFEAPEETPPAPAPAPTAPSSNFGPLRTRVVRASTIDLLNNSLVDLGTTASSAQHTSQVRPSWEEPTPKKALRSVPVGSADPNVLFDAADFELQDEAEGRDDDDFGDFETEPAPTLPPTLSAVSSFGTTQSKKPPPILSPGCPMTITNTIMPGLGSAGLPGTSSFGATQKKHPPNLSLASPTATTFGNGSLYPQAPKSPYGSFQNRKPDPMKELKVKTPQTAEFPKEALAEPHSPSPVTAWPSGDKEKDEYFDDNWADFQDLPPITDAGTNAKTTAKLMPKPDDITEKIKPVLDTTLSSSSSSTNNTTTIGPPPTNIPPPSVLLSIFPQLLDLATTSLLKPVAALPAASQQAVAAHEAVVLFLRGHLALVTVCARIVAGRRLRWHRDKFLMQGMSISSVSGGRKTGMKLAGIDRTQSAREDREAAEVVAVWRAQVGRLRSAVAAANNASSSGAGGVPMKVPELSLSVSAHAAVGALTAPKACVVCGLKRDERIAKVDFDVEDSFGEWWVEFWGHRDCRNFWLQHEVKLRQR